MSSRWLSRDPIGEAGGINLYGYVGASPTLGGDPSGLVPAFLLPVAACAADPVCIIGVGAAVGATGLWVQNNLPLVPSHFPANSTPNSTPSPTPGIAPTTGSGGSEPPCGDLQKCRDAANQPLGKGGLTKAGRALDKHEVGQKRPDFPFPRLSGSNAAKNKVAAEQLEEILNSPNTVFRKLGRGGVEFRLLDGRGVRFNRTVPSVDLLIRVEDCVNQA